MENYENNPIPQESENQHQSFAEPAAQEQTPPVSEPYSGAGVGRKESPFADSQIPEDWGYFHSFP